MLALHHLAWRRALSIGLRPQKAAAISSSAIRCTEASPPEPASTPTTPDTTIARPTEPYFVHRTLSKNLPVFHLAKRGGNLQQTQIRKVEGDAAVLKTQLEREFGMESKDVVVNHLTKHIILKGWRGIEVKRFLEARHF